MANKRQEHKHPIQEAAEAERRLISERRKNLTSFSSFDFRRLTSRPFPFEWTALEQTSKEYGALPYPRFARV